MPLRGDAVRLYYVALGIVMDHYGPIVWAPMKQPVARTEEFEHC